MRKTRLFPACTAVIGALLVFAAPASAEFSALARSSEGEVTDVYQVFEGGGGKFTCENTSNPARWLIENGTEHTEKGPDFVLKLKGWGECIAETTGVKVSATGSECEQRFVEPREEASITETIVSTCTLKAEILGLTCEVKIEPTSNNELKEVTVYNSGEKSEDMTLSYNVSRVTTTVNRACETGGIKSTREGKIEGSSEAKQVMPGRRAGTFVLGATSITFRRRGERRTVTLINNGANGDTPRLFFEAPAASVPFWLIINKRNCEKSYTLRQSCSMEVELSRERAASEPGVTCWVRVVDPNGGEDRVSFFG
jgi:hypothetical protein